MDEHSGVVGPLGVRGAQERERAAGVDSGAACGVADDFEQLGVLDLLAAVGEDEGALTLGAGAPGDGVEVGLGCARDGGAGQPVVAVGESTPRCGGVSISLPLADQRFPALPGGRGDEPDRLALRRPPARSAPDVPRARAPAVDGVRHPHPPRARRAAAAARPEDRLERRGLDGAHPARAGGLAVRRRGPPLGLGVAPDGGGRSGGHEQGARAPAHLRPPPLAM